MRKASNSFKYILLTLLSTCMLAGCSSVPKDTPITPPKSTESATTKSQTPNPNPETIISDSAEETANTTATSSENMATIPEEVHTHVEKHGALRVDGANLVDQNGEPFQLYGMSTHGIGWFPQFVNYDSFLTLRDDWNTNCVRLAMYTAENAGYCTGGNKEQLKALVKDGVNYATELGMYVIIDWHILSDQDPNVYKEDAKAFFTEMSSAYADYSNVLYEICNEPNGSGTWDKIKAYAEEIIPIIRSNDPDAVIIVGTPTWSQDIHLAAESPLEYDNIMYALHFYAATHKDYLRDRLAICAENGLPVFVSEFGTCDASGNGGNDFESTTQWLDLIEKYNLSFCCWNLANKNESSSVFKSSTTSLANWTEEEMNESGIWMRNYFREKAE